MAVSAPYRSAISAGSGLDLTAARSAPDDQPDPGLGGVAERHRWTAGFHLGRYLTLGAMLASPFYFGFSEAGPTDGAGEAL